MSNEELATMVQAGDRERLTELWAQVRRLVQQQARRWATGGSGADMEDLEQAGAIAVIRAADSFDGAKGMFSTHLFPYLKQEFTLATGRQTIREQRDSLQSAASLDAPLTDDEGDPLTLTDMLPDPAAEAAFEEVAENDQAERLRAAMEAAIATLEPEQIAAIRRRYYNQAPALPQDRSGNGTTPPMPPRCGFCDIQAGPGRYWRSGKPFCTRQKTVKTGNTNGLDVGIVAGKCNKMQHKKDGVSAFSAVLKG